MVSIGIFVVFVLLMLAGVPIGVALMLGGAVGIHFAELGWLSIPNNFYAGIAKYPLLALPMFVLVGTLFERSGVAARLVDFAVAIVGRGRGMLPLVAIAVAMFMGGISGSGPATAAAVGAVMLLAMAQRRLSGSLLGIGDRRRRRPGHPHSAFDRLHRLFRAGAGRIGARAVRCRRGAGHPRRSRPDGPGRLAGAPPSDGRQRRAPAPAAVLQGAARTRAGACSRRC